MAKNDTYTYYRLTSRGNRKEQFFSYVDIAYEYGTTKGSIAGKYDRARAKNSNIINVNGNRIEKVKVG